MRSSSTVASRCVVIVVVMAVAAMSELLSCQMCSYFGSHDELLRHVCQIHEHDPNFLIYCSTCSRSFTKLDSFRKHKSRSTKCSSQSDLSHSSLTPQIPTPGPSNDETAPTLDYEGAERSDSHPALRRPSTKWRAASFILGIKEKHLLTQAAIDTVLTSTTSLVDGLLQDFVAELRENLSEEAKAVLDEKVQGCLQPFSGLETAYLQKKYFRESFNLLVSILV